MLHALELLHACFLATSAAWYQTQLQIHTTCSAEQCHEHVGVPGGSSS